jgi:hypothetical protein
MRVSLQPEGRLEFVQLSVTRNVLQNFEFLNTFHLACRSISKSFMHRLFG